MRCSRVKVVARGFWREIVHSNPDLQSAQRLQPDDFPNLLMKNHRSFLNSVCTSTAPFVGAGATRYPSATRLRALISDIWRSEKAVRHLSYSAMPAIRGMQLLARTAPGGCWTELPVQPARTAAGLQSHDCRPTRVPHPADTLCHR